MWSIKTESMRLCHGATKDTVTLLLEWKGNKPKSFFKKKESVKDYTLHYKVVCKGN
jgi:hypothetical protein